MKSHSTVPIWKLNLYPEHRTSEAFSYRFHNTPLNLDSQEKEPILSPICPTPLCTVAPVSTFRTLIMLASLLVTPRYATYRFQRRKGSLGFPPFGQTFQSYHTDQSTIQNTSKSFLDKVYVKGVNCD